MITGIADPGYSMSTCLVQALCETLGHRHDSTQPPTGSCEYLSAEETPSQVRRQGAITEIGHRQCRPIKDESQGSAHDRIK